MPCLELVIFLAICKERLHSFHFKLHVDLGGKLIHHLLKSIMSAGTGLGLLTGEGCIFLALPSVHGASHGGKKMGIVEIDDVLVIQL